MASMVNMAPMNTPTSSVGQERPSLHKDNAIMHWCKFEKMIAGREVVLFLDYDGTLSPIVDQPDKAFMKEGMRPVLAEAARLFTTAIVTGRSKEKVYDFVQLDCVFYAGSHGFEIQGPQETPVTCQMAEDIRPKLEASTADLHSALGHIPKYEIEDNKYSLSVHYRMVPHEHVEELHGIVKEYVAEQSDIVLKHGKKVLELRPKVDWNKGSAVLWILDALGMAGRSDVFPIYIGDDITDEDAFDALQNRTISKVVKGGAAGAVCCGGDVLVGRGGVEDGAAVIGSATGNGSAGGGGRGLNGNRGHHTGEGKEQGDKNNGENRLKHGVGILVKEAFDHERPPETHASFSLRNPNEVQSFLAMLVAYKTTLKN